MSADAGDSKARLEPRLADRLCQLVEIIPALRTVRLEIGDAICQ